MRRDGLAAAVARRWVRIYTSRLPAGEADQRRQEILSDLWEHGEDARRSGASGLRHNLEVIDRVLSGIPSDLSWRRGIQRPQQLRPDTGGSMAYQPISRSTLALIAVAAIGIAAPFPFLALLGTGIAIHEMAWILGSIALAGLLAAGLALRLRAGRPVVSTVLIVIGAFAPTTAWFWLPPVYLLTATVIIVGLVTARNPPLTAPTSA